jgi:predicted transcriptional regulator
MAALSLHLPDDLAQASLSAAHELGISRASFIRQAIIHELGNLAIKQEQADIIKSYKAMNSTPDYLKESEIIDFALNANLPSESENWWKN